MVEVTATEFSRNLSAFLGRVADGEEVTVTKGGRAIARIVPPRRQWVSGAEFLGYLRSGPSPDPEFAADLERIRAEINAQPERATPLEWD